jgi:Pyruvate/2-oxoacid:ferredoxin oxidoreductase delta subunit
MSDVCSMKPFIDKNKCIACCECTDNCPRDAINISSVTGKAHINYKRCNGCGQCIDICPIRAIKRS